MLSTSGTHKVTAYTAPVLNSSGRSRKVKLVAVPSAALLLVRAFNHTVAQYKLVHHSLENIRLLYRAVADEDFVSLVREAQRGSITVAPARCIGSIYGEPGGVWFKWHRAMGRVITGLDDSHAETVELASIQGQHVMYALQLQGATPEQAEFCRALYMADTAGQADHLKEHGALPEDQAAHAHQCLRDWGWLPEPS